MITALAILGAITLACTVAMTVIVGHFMYTDRQRITRKHADVDAMAKRDRLAARCARIEQWHEQPDADEMGIGA